jgi:recombinational DNA repair protein (RecF pathway)
MTESKQCSRCLTHKHPTNDYRKSGGRICNQCIATASRAFYEQNKDRQKIYREAKKAKLPPKPKKPKKSEQEKKESIKLKSHRYHMKKRCRKIIDNLKARTQKKSSDREAYLSNDVWRIDNFRYYVNFQDLMNNPLTDWNIHNFD